MTDEFAAQVAGVGALAEPARRTLYLYVASAADAVSREQAAEACDLPLHSVKFHLDRLVEEGLLDTEFLGSPEGPVRVRADHPSSTGVRSGRSPSPCRSAGTTWPARSSPPRSTAR